MNIIKKIMVMLSYVTFLTGLAISSFAQGDQISFGKSASLYKVISKIKEREMHLLWVNVNTAPDTWHVEKDILICYCTRYMPACGIYRGLLHYS